MVFDTSTDEDEDERRRLAAVLELGLLDTPPEEDFDRLARLTASLLDAPVAMISLVEEDRQFFKARVGTDTCGSEQGISFCTHAIREDNILVIPDTLEDPRFVQSPLVRGPPNARFYAGVPLRMRSGQAVGTLCVIDTEPRPGLTEAERTLLEDCAALVVSRMEMCRLDAVARASQKRLHNIASQSPDSIIGTDAEGRITFWNDSAEQLFGHSSTQAVGQSLQILIPSELRASQLRHLSQLVNRRGGPRAKLVELVAERRNGEQFPVEVSISRWSEAGGVSFAGIVRDISERRRNEERLFRLAQMDPLTGLPNRAELLVQLQAAIQAHRRFALMILDLDGFKKVNDTVGHPAGDLVLREVSGRLSALVSKPHLVARYGGDEFVVLLRDEAGVTAVNELGREIVADLNQPFEGEFDRIEIGVSLGVAICPEHGETAEQLLSAADLALYCAKAAGRNLMRVFRPSLRQATTLRRRLEAELRTAYERDEFQLFYQPQVRLTDGEIVGCEALIRWRHPRRGLLTPKDFLSVLESSPLAPSVGSWAIRTACSQASQWLRELGRDIRIAVNLFNAQFSIRNLCEIVRVVLDSSGLPPELLELEITENIILRQDEALLEPLNRLHDMGVGIAFDDYGTGYASLSLLKRFPLSCLKIDRSFVRDVTQDEQDAAIVRAVISLARPFKLRVVGEGIETLEEHKFLRNSGCDEGQGYLYGHPKPAEEFAELVSRWRAPLVA